MSSARAGAGDGAVVGSMRDGAGGVNRVTSGAAGVSMAANETDEGIGCSTGLGGAGLRKAGDVGGSIHGSVVDLVESRVGPVRGSVRSVVARCAARFPGRSRCSRGRRRGGRPCRLGRRRSIARAGASDGVGGDRLELDCQ